MLSTLARNGRCGTRLLLQRGLHASGTAFSDPTRDAEGKPQEAPMVFTRTRDGDKKGLRYFVLEDHAATNPALALLEKALYRTPMPGPPGKPPRFFSVPQPGVCNSLLTKAAENPGLAGKAAELAEALLLQGTPLDVHTLKAIIASLARGDELAGALPVLDAWLQQQEEALEEDAHVQAPLQVMSLLMDTATRAENTQVVLQVLARMARIGVTPSPQSLTTLLQCFVRLGQVQVAHQVLDWMRRNNLEPNVYSYTALLAMPRNMSEAAASQLLEQARSAYGKMRQDGVQPNARFFTEYIRICGRANNLAAAEAAWEDAQEAGVRRDLILFSAMIDTCAKCRDPAAAMRVFMQMRQTGLQPDVVAYTSLLTALQGSPNAAATARDLWRSMGQDGVRPNGMAVAAFLEILLLEGEVDEALQTLAAAQPGSQGSRAKRGGAKTTWQRKGERLAQEAGLALEGEQGRRMAAAAGPEEEEEARDLGAVDLPRLYEHFLFAMAHKGQNAVVEQMARHMRSRGLPQTLGTASALLTAQALQQGHSNAKWLLQPSPPSQPQGSGGGGGGGGGKGGAWSTSAATVQLPDEMVESCLLGRGSPRDCMHKLLQAPPVGVLPGGAAAVAPAGGPGAPRPASTMHANIVLAGLAVRGSTDDALRLYEWMKERRSQAAASAAAAAAPGPEKKTPQRQQQQQQQQQGARGAVRAEAVAAAASCAPNWWTHQLLLFLALNAPKERQLELALMAVKEAREFAAAERGHSKRRGGGGVPAWDGRTRHAIAAVIRQSEQARALLGDGVAAAAAEEREERLQQLKGLLG